jgi:DNA-directed RNA polymerase specialized sigma24 family protein
VANMGRGQETNPPALLPPPKEQAHSPTVIPPGLAAFLDGAARAAEWLGPVTTRLYEASQEEPWKSILDTLAHVILNWPKDNNGRPLELEEFNYGFAAVAAVKKAPADPKALDKFLLEGAAGERGRLKLDLGLRAKNEEQLQRWRLVLWEIVTEQLETPYSESDGWFFDSERCREKLRVELLAPYGRVRDTWEDRVIADEPWESPKLRAVRQKKKANLPKQQGFDPEQHGGTEKDPAEAVGLTNADVMELLTELQREELEKFYLKQLESVLPEQQYQVLARRVEGCTYKAIGRELGITDGAAKSHMARVRQNPDARRLAKGWM